MSNFCMKLSAFTLFAFFLSVSVAFGFPADEKMKPEEIIAKHLESIGSKEALSKINNQVIQSSLDFKFRGLTTPVKGIAIFASTREKSLWGLNLNSNDYPQDKFAFNGKKVMVAYTKPGTRSDLATFIFDYNEILEEGLFGGTLSSTWSLENLEARRPKISPEGTKEVNGKQAYVLEYRPKGKSDLTIKLYFDKTNFQHIRTEYSRVISATMAGAQAGSASIAGPRNLDGAAGQGSNRFRLVEDFSEFQKVNGITIPGTYKVSYSYFTDQASQSSKGRSREAEWNFKITNALFNQDLDESSFEVPIN